MRRTALFLLCSLAVALGAFAVWRWPTEPAPATPLEKARARLERARQTEGEESAAVARALHSLVGHLFRAGELGEETLSCARRAVELKREFLERAEDPGEREKAEISLSRSLNNLASVLLARHQLEEAERRYEEALGIQRRHLAGEPKLGTLLSNVGEAYRRMGDYTKARAHYEEALELLRGHEHEASAWNNLGLLNLEMNDLEEARRCLERAERAWVENDPHNNLPKVLNTLGLLHHLADRHDKARDHFERALAIWNEAPSSNPIERASVLNNLGFLLHDLGSLDEALELYSESLAIRRQVLGADHVDLAWSHGNLGLLLYQRGDLEGAHRHFEAGLRIRRRLGDRWLGHSLTYLARLHFDLGDAETALRLAVEAEELRREDLLVNLWGQTERRALRLREQEVFGLEHSALDLALSVLADDADLEVPRATSTVWDSLVHFRALVFDEVVARQRVLSESRDPEFRRLVSEWNEARQRLSNLWTRGEVKALEAARRRKERAEEALADQSRILREDRRRSPIGFAGVRAGLLRRQRPTALVAYTQYNRVVRGSLATESSYAAFVATSTAGEPRFIPLAPAREADALIERWRREIVRGALRDADGTALDSYREAAVELRRTLWDPVAEHLDDVELLFVVPDGQLYAVSFATLPAEPDGFLIERGPRLHYIYAERDLVEIARGGGRSPTPGGFLGVSDPAFDPESNFHPLPATAEEVRDIVDLLQSDRTPPVVTAASTRHLTGIEATETAFRELAPGRRILHVATHGFYRSNRPAEAEAVPSTRGVKTVSVVDLAADARHALLDSGLALAKSGEDDGVLLAEEVATLDLDAVEWAVLSACESGLGEVHRGEGVFGLQRSFGLAGARTVILSLWPVEDRATREWMVQLYEARFVDGLSTPESLHRACLRTLRARRDRGEPAHPFFWGAFVAVGDWR